jgi:hypothetical protein
MIKLARIILVRFVFKEILKIGRKGKLTAVKNNINVVPVNNEP